MKRENLKIVIGVTSSESMRLMSGFPEFLRSKGWEVVVVSSWNGSSVPGPTKNLKFIDIKMLRKPSLFQDLKSFWNWYLTIRSEKPDVVMGGTPKAGLMSISAAYFNRIPVRIYHLRGLRAESARRGYKQFLLFLEKLVITFSTKVLCVSQSLGELIQELKLSPPEKVCVLGRGSSNGVQTMDFRKVNNYSEEAELFSKRANLIPQLTTVGYIGRLNNDKGVRNLLEAHKLLLSKDVNHQLLIVGESEDLDLVKQIQDCHDETNKISIVGRINIPSIAYQVIDILCLPTLREGFPNVILEAGASQLPSVTTNATGARDSVLDGVTGLIVPVNNSIQLANALQRLIEDEHLRNVLGQEAFNFVNKYYERSHIWNLTYQFLINEFEDSKRS